MTTADQPQLTRKRYSLTAYGPDKSVVATEYSDDREALAKKAATIGAAADDEWVSLTSWWEQLWFRRGEIARIKVMDHHLYMDKHQRLELFDEDDQPTQRYRDLVAGRETTPEG